MLTDKNNISHQFKIIFNTVEEPFVFRSPGRVNIIGEHTDYNDGFVLPAAIDKAAYVAISKRADNTIALFANQFQQTHETVLSKIIKSAKGWPNYVLGIVDQLQKMGLQPGGFNLFIDGDIPIGAGLSSSAALECVTVFALNEIFQLSLSKAEMAHLTQQAEHQFAGVKCGVMDMFTSLFGKKDQVILLDCRSLLYEYVPFNISGYKLLLLNTNVKHELAATAYNERRQQCEQGVAWVNRFVDGVKALRDVTIAMLDQYVLKKDALIYQRCKYVIEENNRVLQSCEDLKNGHLKSLGEKMFETHDGLSKLYEVSCKELDYLVEAVKNNPKVLGARMMGGGFGGCTINLVNENEIEELVASIKPGYEKAMGLPLSYYVASIENGTEEI